MTKEQQLAAQIVHLAGGSENINTVAFCMTRLRLTLHDRSLVDDKELKKISGVLGVVEAGGQLQIVLGPGVVNKAAAAVNELLACPAPKAEGAVSLPAEQTEDFAGKNAGAELKAAIAARNRTPFKLLLRQLANIFVPLIPALVASGMIAGLANMAVRAGADPQQPLVLMLGAIGWGLFAYLFVFVGINAAKEFGGTPALGGLAGVLLINPAIAQVEVYGSFLVPGRGGIIGVLLVAFCMAWLEKQLRKIVPAVLDIIITPTVTLLVTGIAAYYVLQPVGGVLSDGIVAFFAVMLNHGGPAAGFVLAGSILPVIMTGLHQGLTPVHMEFLNVLKENPLLPILAMGGAGQIGATLAVYMKTRSRRLKNIIKGALPVAFLGIGEPLIFGVTMPLGRPFITACIGAACGGAYQAMMQVSSIAMGLSGLPLVFLIKAGSALHYLVGLLVAYAAGFAVTWAVGFDDPAEDEAGSKEEERHA